MSRTARPPDEVQSHGQSVERDAGENERVARTAHFTFRLPPDELAALELAASAVGMSLSEYVRRAAALRPAASVLVKPQVSIMIGTPYSQSGSSIAWNDAEPDASAMSESLSAALTEQAAEQTRLTGTH